MKDQTADSVNDIVQGLLDYLANEDSEDLLPAIAAKLYHIVRQNEQTGHIISSVPLSAGQIKQAEELLSKKINQEVRLVNRVDRSILGGLIIRYKDMVIDQSIAGKLARLSEKLYESK